MAVFKVQFSVPLNFPQKKVRTHCTEFRYLSVGVAFALLRLPSTLVNVYLIGNRHNYRTMTAAVLNIIAVSVCSNLMSHVCTELYSRTVSQVYTGLYLYCLY